MGVNWSVIFHVEGSKLLPNRFTSFSRIYSGGCLKSYFQNAMVFKNYIKKVSWEGGVHFSSCKKTDGVIIQQ